VTLDAVYQVKKRKNWDLRAEERDRQIRAEIDRKTVKTHAQRVIENLKVLDAMKAMFARQLMPGSPNKVENITPREYLEILKMELTLTGNPTEIVGDPVKPRTLQEIETEIAELSDAEVDHEIKVISRLADGRRR
jgi:hypothetical protein